MTAFAAAPLIKPPALRGVSDCTASGTQVTVDLPDLVEVALSNPPATVARRKSFSVSDTVWNAGAAPAGASTTQYYLSLDTQKNSGDVLLSGTRSVPTLVPGLGANAFSSGTVKVTAPTATPLGTYFLMACADDKNAVTEKNETNNCMVVSGSTMTVTK